MDDALLRQIVRQLKFINFWISFFGITILIGFVITGIVLYKIISTANNSIKKFENFQQQTAKNLDVKQQLCGNNIVQALLGSQNQICR